MFAFPSHHILSQLRWVTVATFLAVAMCFIPLTASADDDRATRAVEYFNLGAEKFHEGRYGAALVEFRRAYRLEPDPIILYNKSLAHLRLGNLKDALEMALELDEEHQLPPREQVRNRARIDAIEIALHTKEIQADIENIATGDEPSTEQASLSDELEMSEESSLGKRGWTGIATLSSGVGLLGYALVVDYRLDDRIEAYEQAAHDGDTDRYLTLRDEIDTSTTRGLTAMYSGIGLLGIGTALLITDRLGRSESPSGTARLRPGATFGDNSGTIFQLSGQF